MLVEFDIFDWVKVKWTGPTKGRWFLEKDCAYLTEVFPDSDGYVELELFNAVSIIQDCHSREEDAPFDYLAVMEAAPVSFDDKN